MTPAWVEGHSWQQSEAFSEFVFTEEGEEVPQRLQILATLGEMFFT